MSFNPSNSPRYKKRSHLIWDIVLSTIIVLALRNITTPIYFASYKGDGIQKTKSRVAVVVSTGNLDNECQESRLRQWVNSTRHNATTASSLFDIWVSYRRPVHLRHQTRHETIIASIPDLYRHFQHEKNIATFDTIYSGSSKSSFLRFAQEHSQEYDYVWHVEDDVIYTGHWKDLLEDENLLRGSDDPQNTIITTIYRQKLTNWPWFESCRWNGTKCGSFGDVHQVGWMMIRFPMKLALKLWQDVSSKQLQGHHEAVVGTFCALHDCQIRKVPTSRVGSVKPGHTKGNDPSVPVERWKRGKLYHPVKCWAFPEPGSMAKIQEQYASETRPFSFFKYVRVYG